MSQRSYPLCPAPFCPLLALPTEIRLHILSYSISYPNLHDAFLRARRIDREARDAWDEDGPAACAPKPNIPTYTPPILLVCRTITEEALDQLFRTPLIIEPSCPGSYTGKEFFITEFIGVELLKRIRYAEIKLRGINYFLLMDLVDAWKENSGLECITLRIQGSLTEKSDYEYWETGLQGCGLDAKDRTLEFSVRKARTNLDTKIRQLHEVEMWIDEWTFKAVEEYVVSSQGQDSYWSPERSRKYAIRYWDTYKKEVLAFLTEVSLTPGTYGS